MEKIESPPVALAPNTGRYNESGQRAKKPADVWVVNQAGRTVALEGDSIYAAHLLGILDPKRAETNLIGWRLATPDEIGLAQKKLIEEGKKWQAVREAELDKKQPKVVIVEGKAKKE